MILVFRLPSTILNQAPFSFIYLNFGYGVQIHFSLEYSIFNQHKLVDGENTGPRGEIHASINLLSVNDERAEKSVCHSISNPSFTKVIK